MNYLCYPLCNRFILSYSMNRFPYKTLQNFRSNTRYHLVPSIMMASSSTHLLGLRCPPVRGSGSTTLHMTAQIQAVDRGDSSTQEDIRFDSLSLRKKKVIMWSMWYEEPHFCTSLHVLLPYMCCQFSGSHIHCLVLFFFLVQQKSEWSSYGCFRSTSFGARQKRVVCKFKLFFLIQR